MIELIERREPLSRRCLEVCIDVVFHDHEVVLLRELQQLERDLRRDVGRGWVMKHGVDEEQFRLDGLEQMLGNIHIRPARQARNADNPDTLKLEQPEQIVVPGIFHKYGIAWLQHEPDDQIERLARTARDNHVRDVRLDADYREAHLDLMPQIRVTVRHGVVDHATRVHPHDLTHGLSDALDVSPRFGHEPAAQLQGLAWIVELLQDLMGFFLSKTRVRAARGAALAPHMVRHIEARTMLRHDKTQRRKPVIRLDYRKAADLLAGRERPDGRQLHTGQKLPRTDQTRNAGHELIGHGNAISRIDD